MTVSPYDVARWCTFKVSPYRYDYARILSVKANKVTILTDGSSFCFDVECEDVIGAFDFRIEALTKAKKLNGDLNDSQKRDNTRT